MAQSNVEALDNLSENLAELGLDIRNVPLVLQYNKRDLSEVQSLGQLDKSLNRNGWESYEASALTGTGVFETLRGISRLTLLSLRDQLEMTPGGRRAPVPDQAVVTKSSRVPRPSIADKAPSQRKGPAAPIAKTAAVEDPMTASTPAPQVEGGESRLATGSETGSVTPAGLPTRKPVRKDLLLRLPATDFERTKRLAVRLILEDSKGQVVRVTRDVRLELDPSSTDEALLSLNLALRSDD
jgi:hypothetical protein